ncbi:protein S100-P-like [Brachyistius frenatus]|uniref:protein S100-P-like n=1 Tax=Brachyistius frenatus TaxID=100188 RepID=UPI0037E960D1
MASLEKSMENILLIFDRYAKESGNKKTLNKKELKKLIENELPTFMMGNPDAVKNIMKDLDQNKDDELDFEEFLPFIAGLLLACEKYRSTLSKKGGK